MINGGLQGVGARPAHLPLQGFGDILIERQRCSHIMMLAYCHHYVKMTRTPPHLLPSQKPCLLTTLPPLFAEAGHRLFCYDEAMRNRVSLLVFFCSFFSLCQAGFGQGATGTLDLTARIAPTGARPEPVRQFTFYILTKSYADILKEAADQFPLAEREEFINKLKISPELKAWMKQH